jgi:hypothetical protein
MASIIRRCALCMCVLLAACAVHHVSPEDPTGSIPDRSAQVVAGHTERTDVRRALGTPIISSTHWRFDLFRATTEQSEVVFAVTPWPVPFARLEDQLQRYTLVAYDAQSRATAVASGLFRKPATWRNTAPISSDFRALHLRAAALMFFVDPEGARETNLLVVPSRRDVFLADARSSKGCTVVLGCGGRGCADQLLVDAGPVRRLPVRTAHVYWISATERDAWLQDTEPHGTDPKMPWLEALVAIELAAGEHTFVFSAKHFDGSGSSQLACRPGDVTYLTIDAFSDESFWRKALVDWQITQSNAMPEYFKGRGLVLLDDGRWYVDAEPGSSR